MHTADVLMRLSKRLAKAYAEAIGPKPPKKGMKKLPTKDHRKYFHSLVRHLTQIRRATVLPKKVDAAVRYRKFLASPGNGEPPPNPKPPKPPPPIACVQEGWCWCMGHCLPCVDCGAIMAKRPTPKLRRKLTRVKRRVR